MSEHDPNVSLSPGAVVFGRVKGFPWWPAVVSCCKDTTVWQRNDGRVWCLFFNDPSGAWLRPSEIRPFNKYHREEVLVINQSNSKHRKFRERIAEALTCADQYSLTIPQSPPPPDVQPRSLAPWAKAYADRASSVMSDTAMNGAPDAHATTYADLPMATGATNVAVTSPGIPAPPANSASDNTCEPNTTGRPAAVVPLSLQITEPASADDSGPCAVSRSNSSPDEATAPQATTQKSNEDAVSVGSPSPMAGDEAATGSQGGDSSRPRRKRTKSMRYEGFVNPFDTETRRQKPRLENDELRPGAPAAGKAHDNKPPRAFEDGPGRNSLEDPARVIVPPKGSPSGSVSQSGPGALAKSPGHSASPHANGPDAEQAGTAKPEPPTAASGRPKRKSSRIAARVVESVGSEGSARAKVDAKRKSTPPMAARVESSSGPPEPAVEEQSGKRRRSAPAAAERTLNVRVTCKGQTVSLSQAPTSMIQRKAAEETFHVVPAKPQRPPGVEKVEHVRKSDGMTDTESDPDYSQPRLANRTAAAADRLMDTVFDSHVAAIGRRARHDSSNAAASRPSHSGRGAVMVDSDLVGTLLARVQTLENDVASLRKHVAVTENASLGEDSTAAGLKTAVEALWSASGAFAKAREFDPGTISRAMELLWDENDRRFAAQDKQLLFDVAKSVIASMCKRNLAVKPG